MKPSPRLVALALVPLLALAACGDPDTVDRADSPSTSPTAPGDATTVPPGAPDITAALARAGSLLGTAEVDLPEDVRIARRGDEQFALTTDLVPGRLTVELDEDDAGQYVVTSVAVESEDGSQVVTVDSLLESAAAILGTPEPGLDPSWRIGRRGEETFALTDDFVVGRYTVELDDDGTGAYVVTAVIVEVPGGAQTVSEETLLDGAAALIGTAEADLPEDARIGRRGEEQFPLTTDLRVGRYTFELDDDGTGTYRVVSVQVELLDRVETVTAQN